MSVVGGCDPAPIEAFKQSLELRLGQRHRATLHFRPDETAALDTLVPYLRMQPRPAQVSS